jgi:hypothetical protein
MAKGRKTKGKTFKLDFSKETGQEVNRHLQKLSSIIKKKDQEAEGLAMRRRQIEDAFRKIENKRAK